MICVFQIIMTESKLLVLSIIRFLRQESENEQLDADTVEAIEVASQCLENAFNISQPDYDHNILNLLSLKSIFHDHVSKLVSGAQGFVRSIFLNQ